MKAKKQFWGAAAFALCLCSLLFIGFGLFARPVAAVSHDRLTEAADAFLECARTADPEEMARMLAGSPDLGQRPDGDLPEGMLWDAFFASLQFRLPDTHYVTDEGPAMDVEVICTDVGTVLEMLEKTVPTALARQGKEIGAEALDETGAYRPEFAEKVLALTVREVLQDCPVRRENLTLRFTREAGNWKILPTPELLQLLGCYAS